MKRIPTRRGILGGGLLLAAAVWGFDHLSGGHPATVQASPAAVTSGPAAPANWEPIEDLIGRLTKDDYVSIAEDLDRSERDLFLPTAAIEETVAPVEPVRGGGLAALAVADGGEGTAAESGFAKRHKLTGVVVGSVSAGGTPTPPLAVVDNRVLTLNSDLDGYTLIEVQRDYVVFRRASSGERVTLELEQGPKTP